MGKENQSSTASFKWNGCVKEDKDDVVFNTAKDLLYLSDEFTKENIDEAIELATYLYERIYENKKSVIDKEEEEFNKQKIEYLLEAKKQIEDLLKKCQGKQK